MARDGITARGLGGKHRVRDAPCNPASGGVDRRRRACEGFPAMEPVINFEEKIGKTVGRRKAPKDSFAYGMGLQRTGAALARSFKHGGICPRGVYRFKTHEEADAWMMKMLSRRHRTES